MMRIGIDPDHNYICLDCLHISEHEKYTENCEKCDSDNLDYYRNIHEKLINLKEIK